MLFAILFFILMSAFLSGSETALTAVNKMKIKTKADHGDPKSVKLLSLVSKPDELITGILIGNNIANIMLPTLVTMIAIQYGFNVGLATGILTVFLIMFGEVLPKTIAATFSEKIAYIVAPVISILLVILKPLTFLLSKFTGLVISFLSRGETQEASISKAELKTMLDIASTEGTFQTDETQRIKGVIDFYSKAVNDALKTPRMDIVGIPQGASFEEAQEVILNNNYTRYPIYQENMDQIVGVFHSKLLLKWALAPEKKIEVFADNDPLFVTEFTSIEKVFKMMLNEKKHLAIVLDEYGGTSGIITHEDIIEAMLGQDIEDETDRDNELLIQELTDRKIVCNGRISLRRLNQVFGTALSEKEGTLSGFLFKEFGSIPSEGDVLDYEDLRFVIKIMDYNRIKEVEIHKQEQESASEEGPLE
ncbi:hemolysin family protein [Bacillus thermotolerans]|uniref:Magnesium and cobalt efflux protein CorC n=1 Tax=Bacillus thermotolerans TaxID=1221996 RepID=A0A0F5IC37_BACTR|nr:CNNM domain-containing protein [Bacillus thermotolerans]KKB39117.1 Magnesium and cobalt efflux protein CorC [Bacillus thermotolerans]KKB41596.1 Magnesium and cobalt efflux protein CorC [Bacillus thermotolerans]KKB42737.1 Magnesium and cobalt efflux protein CorC [Bacillus thermotolerans]